MDIDVTEVKRPSKGDNVSVHDRRNHQTDFHQSCEERGFNELTDPVDGRL
jgi:hypothetical protein